MYGYPGTQSYGPVPGSGIPGTQMLTPGRGDPLSSFNAGASGVPYPSAAGTSVMPGTMMLNQGSAYENPHYDPQHRLEQQHRAHSFRSTGSASSQEEAKPLKGSRKDLQGTDRGFGAFGGVLAPGLRSKSRQVDPQLFVKLTMYVIATFVACASCRLLYQAFSTLFDHGFLVFSTLSYYIWYPSLYAFLVVLCVASICGLVCACLAYLGTHKLQRAVLKAARSFSGAFGILTLVLIGVFWYYSDLATPDIVRVGNLICQDTSVWCNDHAGATSPSPSPSDWIGGEDAASGSPSVAPSVAGGGAEAQGGGSQRRMQNVYADGESTRRKSASMADDIFEGNGDAHGTRLRFLTAGEATTAARRLSDVLAKAALDFDHVLHQQDPALPCAEVQKICQTPPPHLDALEACMCSGDWDYNGHMPSAQNSIMTRRLELGVDAPGPWQGTKGAYCDTWDDHLGDPLNWCFVQASTKCDLPVTPYQTSTHQEKYRSAGPCTSEVASRSQYILDGAAAFKEPLYTGVVLAFLLLLEALVAHGLTFVKRRANSHLGVRGARGMKGAGAVDLAKLNAEFAQAQQIAMLKLSDVTPEHQKLALYGFYKQATEGDNTTGRPSSYFGFTTTREQEKWDAWNRLQGMDREEAIRNYITVAGLLD